MVFEKRVGTPHAKMEGVLPHPDAAKLETHDELGLSMDPAHWAKPNCKGCDGRGVTALREVGSLDQAKMGICERQGCSLKKYQKIRERLQNAVLRVWEEGKSNEDIRKAAMLWLVQRAHVEIKVGGDLSTSTFEAATRAAIQRSIITT